MLGPVRNFSAVLLGLAVGCSSSVTTTAEPSPPPDAAMQAADAALPDASPPDAAPKTTLTRAELDKIVRCIGAVCHVIAPVTDLAAKTLSDKPGYRTSRFEVKLAFVSSLAKLPWLRRLTIIDSGALDTSQVAVLNDLESLTITHADPGAAPFTELGKLTKLRMLAVSAASATSLAGIDKLTELRFLSLHNLAKLDVGELRHLEALTKLDYLGLRRAPGVTDLRSVAKLKQLENLEIAHLPLRNLDALRKHPGLQRIRLSALSKLRSLAPLGTLPALHTLETSYMDSVSYNGIGRAKKLELLRIQLDKRVKAPKLRGMRWLKRLDLSKGPVRDLRPLARAGLRSLEHINLEATEVDDIRPLRRLAKLRRLNLEHTKVTSILPLARIRTLERIDMTSHPKDEATFHSKRPKVVVYVGRARH